MVERESTLSFSFSRVPKELHDMVLFLQIIREFSYVSISNEILGNCRKKLKNFVLTDTLKSQHIYLVTVKRMFFAFLCASIW